MLQLVYDLPSGLALVSKYKPPKISPRLRCCLRQTFYPWRLLRQCYSVHAFLCCVIIFLLHISKSWLSFNPATSTDPHSLHQQKHRRTVQPKIWQLFACVNVIKLATILITATNGSLILSYPAHPPSSESSSSFGTSQSRGYHPTMLHPSIHTHCTNTSIDCPHQSSDGRSLPVIVNKFATILVTAAVVSLNTVLRPCIHASSNPSSNSSMVPFHLGLVLWAATG